MAETVPQGTQKCPSAPPLIAMSEDTQRPVIIDGANAARMYLDKPRGDALGLIEIYNFCKLHGHEYVRIYIKNYRVKGRPEEVMFNVDKFNEEIPDSDVVIIPVDLDDDSFFIRDAIEKDAILVTNDRLKDHQEKLIGKDRSRFDKWIKRSRCGFTFVDGDFSPDPNFSDFHYQPLAVDDEGEESIELEALQSRLVMEGIKKRRELKERIMEELAPISTDELQSMLRDESSQLQRHREDRDEMNSAVRESLDLRNGINAKVKEKIADVAAFKRMRDKHNSLVKDEKQNREELDRRLKDARNQSAPEKSEIRELERSQEQAHTRVQKEATKAQAAQESIEETGMVIENLRDEANDAHKNFTINKRTADDFHESFRHGTAVISAINRIIRNRKKEEEKLASRVHVDAAMSKITSHSTAELRRMLIDTIISLEHWEKLSRSETLTKKLEGILIRVGEAGGQYAQLEIISSNIARYIIGRRGATIKLTIEKMAAELDVDPKYFRIFVRTPKRGQRYEEFFDDFTLEELREFAPQIGLKKGGNKSELIERLIRGAFLQSVD